MRQPPPSLPPGQPDPVLLRRLLYVQRACLALVALITITAFAAWLFPAVNDYLPIFAIHTSIPMAVTALLCAFSLVLSEPGSSLPLPGPSRYIALLAAFIAVSVLFESVVHFSPAIDSVLDTVQTASTRGSSLPLQPAAAFAYLAVVIILVSSNRAFIRRATDIFVSCLCLLAMILVAENLFVAMGRSGLPASGLISPLVLSCLLLLTAVVTIRQSEHGVFSIFLGRGIGSRIARGFAPILLVLPFLTEVARIRVALGEVIPAQYAAAILTSTIAVFSLVLLLFLVWRINGMEQSIHDLTLRDELTGLYNMRGFYLLAEQTLRLAQRARLPFSVLFIDLDGLKIINDQMGHNTGSAYLAETGELVLACFREGDVKGRFGGDEFVIAGQFSRVGMEIAVHRLQMAAAERNQSANRRFPLSFSIGHVTCDYYSQETLKELVTRADEAMYRDKRSKKVQRR
jgi:diguanylate cyclase (GGDEF)-like protein